MGCVLMLTLPYHYHYNQQMFNSKRTAHWVDDPIDTTLTTKGYLSDGCSHPVSIYGYFGNDFFDVLRNKCILDLNGESGESLLVGALVGMPVKVNPNLIARN